MTWKPGPTRSHPSGEIVEDEYPDWGTAWPAPEIDRVFALPPPNSPAWDLMMLGQYAIEMMLAGEGGRLPKADALMKLASHAGMNRTWLPDCPHAHVDRKLARLLAKAAKRLNRALKEVP